MSDGRTHIKASLILAGGFGVSTVLTQEPSNLLYSFGALLGIMLSPDLDLDVKNVSSTIMRKKVGWFGESAWDATWHFYRKSLKHGSPLSHLPVIGTLGRIIYLFCLFIVVPTVVLKFLFFPNLNLMYELTWWTNILVTGYKVVLGLMASDLIHFFLDLLTTEHKNERRPQLPEDEDSKRITQERT